MTITGRRQYAQGHYPRDYGFRNVDHKAVLEALKIRYHDIQFRGEDKINLLGMLRSNKTSVIPEHLRKEE
jgi:hypothetical protein